MENTVDAGLTEIEVALSSTDLDAGDDCEAWPASAKLRDVLERQASIRVIGIDQAAVECVAAECLEQGVPGSAHHDAVVGT